MFGGKDSADTRDADAKLPDGLRACEGQETLEAGREVRRGESKLQPKHHAPDIPNLRFGSVRGVGFSCLPVCVAGLRVGGWVYDGNPQFDRSAFG